MHLEPYHDDPVFRSHFQYNFPTKKNADAHLNLTLLSILFPSVTISTVSDTFCTYCLRYRDWILASINRVPSTQQHNNGHTKPNGRVPLKPIYTLSRLHHSYNYTRTHKHSLSIPNSYIYDFMHHHFISPQKHTYIYTSYIQNLTYT